MLRSSEKVVLTRAARRAAFPLPRRAAWLASAAGAAFLLASCATVPLRAPSEWLGVLPSGATLYASLFVPSSADFIKKMLKDAGTGFQDVAALVDRSKRVVASVTLVTGESARFSVVALGNYPSGIIGMRLGGNKEWKKASSSAGSWWEWSKAGLQMVIPNNGILLASNGDVEMLLGRWSSPPALVVPPDVADDMRTGDLVVYMPELPGGLAQSAARSDARIPIQEVWLKALKNKDGYDVSGTANTGSEREAKLLNLALRLAIVAWMRTGNIPDATARLKAITVGAVGVQVRLAGLQLSESEIVPLFLSLVKGLSPDQGAAPDVASDAPSSGSDDTSGPSAEGIAP